MKIKQIASIAIIAVLPFGVNATQTIVTTQTPAAVGANGTVNQAATSGPYQTATIGEHDDEHIATTAYVKGAYNDAIAAVNKVDDDKQDRLVDYLSNDPTVGNKVITRDVINIGEASGYMGELIAYSDDGDFIEEISNSLEGQGFANGGDGYGQHFLISYGAVLELLGVAGNELKNVTDTKLDSKRVKIYTTWDDDRDSATTLVEFATAQ